MSAVRSRSLEANRRRIFRLAAPVFRAQGYRAAKVALISRAVGLAPGSLYHYFPSKKALALFPLSSENDICGRMHASLDAVPRDKPLEPLRILVDYWTDELPDVLLANRLAQSIGCEQWALSQMKEMYDFGLQLIASIVCTAAPSFTVEQAQEIGRVLMSMLSGSAIADLDLNHEKLRKDAVSVLRRYLTPDAVSPAAFEAAISPC
jgi:AcrR family transcriptional regulator